MNRPGIERDFLRFVCQTSSDPLGIVVERARGLSIWDTRGREYLDLLAGMLAAARVSERDGSRPAERSGRPATVNYLI